MGVLIMEIDMNKDRMKKFGAFLKARREELNLTQQQLAKAVGYDQSQIISNIERGVAKIPVAKIPVFSDVLRLPSQKLQLDLIALDLGPELADRLDVVRCDAVHLMLKNYKQADDITKDKFITSVASLFSLDGAMLKRDLEAINVPLN